MLSPVLDVLIGMVLVFATMSLAAAAINEAIAKALALRGAHLFKMLADVLDRQTLSNVFGRLDALGLPRARSIFQLLGDAKGQLEYVARDPFVAVLIEQAAKVSSDGAPSNTLPPALADLVTMAKGDAAKLAQSVQIWADNLLDRSSRLYARRAHLFVFVIGLGLSAWFDVSALRLVDFLWHNETARSQMVALAARAPDSDVETLGKELRVQIGLPARQWILEPLLPDLVGQPAPDKERRIPTPFTLLGWVITALATVAGSKFWFDALAGLMRFKPKTA